MIKRISMLLLIVLSGATAATAQQVTNDCDPYKLNSSDLSISVADLTAPAAPVRADAMQKLGMNPEVLMSIADSLTPNIITESTDSVAALAPASTAIVTRDDARLHIHDGVCLDTPVLAELMDGMRVTVLDGPIASEGFAWWRVRRANITGWVVEGTDEEIWLQSLR